MTKEEELKELQELEELAQLEALAEQEDSSEEAAFQEDISNAALDELSQSELPAPKPESAEKLASFASGALQGIPFAKDLYSGGEAVKAALFEDGVDFSVEAIGKRYDENLKAINEEMRYYEDRYPTQFNAGQISSGAALVFGAPVLGSSLLGIGALGAAHGLSVSEQRTAEDAIGGAASALVFDRLGVFSAKTLGKAAKVVSNIADDTVQNAIGALNGPAFKKIYAHLKRTGQSVSQFADDVMSMKVVDIDSGNNVKNIENLIKPNQSFEITLDKVKKLKSEVGESLGTILSTLDDQFGTKAQIPAADLHATLRAKLLTDLKTSNNPDTVNLGNQLESYLREMFQFPEETIRQTAKGPESEIVWKYKKDFTLQSLHQLAKDVSEFTEKQYGKIPGMTSEGSLAAQKKNVDGIIREVLDNKVASFQAVPGIRNEVDNSALNLFQQAKRDYGNLALMDELLTGAVAPKNDGIFGKLKDSVNIKGMMITGVGSQLLGLDASTSIAASVAVNQFLVSQKTPATMAVGLRKLAEGLSKSPNPDVARKIFIAAQHGTVDDFRGKIAFGVAHYETIGKPFTRSLEDVKRRNNVLYTLIREEDPQLADEFASVIDTEDDNLIGAFMEGLENHPKAKQYIQKGFGWDGKVFSPEAKAQAMKSVDNANLPLGQALRLKEQIRKNGTIPDLTPIPNQPSKWSPRNKSFPKY